MALAILVLSGASLCTGQGTYTAASCNRSDVNAVINGPTHTAVSGDVIIIPTTGSPCTWTSGITINGVGIDITGTGTPNTGGGTFGAGTSNTTLIDDIPGAFFSFTNLSYGQTAKVELLTLSAAGAAANSIVPGAIGFSGTCTASGCANIRVDNITFATGTWGNSAALGALVNTDDVFGVIDHNSMNESPTGGVVGPPLVDSAYSSWQGVGSNGDNSFATPDTFGTSQELYLENNVSTGLRLSDNDVPPAGGGTGGARLVCRFNEILQLNGTGACTGVHATAWGGRFRGQRQLEAYYNTIAANYYANVGFAVPSGTGYVLSNSFTGTNGYNAAVDIPQFRTTAGGGKDEAPWYNCDGTQPWDQVPWNSTSQCLDQPGTGQGLLLANATPALASALGTPCSIAGQCWPQNVKDPIYEAGDTGSSLVAGSETADPTRFAGYYYAEVSKTANSGCPSSCTPFTGASGTGYGTLSQRPACTSGCTLGVGYWATDQGNWNTYSSSQEGELFVLTAPGTWTMKYEPYTYPHPLTTGGGGTLGSGDPPNPPTGLTAAVE